MESLRKNPYKWLPDQIEVNREERIKALKKRQESPTQVRNDSNLQTESQTYSCQPR